MLRINPFVARLFPRLITQLVPAALVTTVGVLLLSSLGKTPSPAPETPPAEVAINAEAVFTATPREPEIQADDQEAKSKSAATRPAKPRPAVANTAGPQPRKPNEPAARQLASAPAPLPTIQIPAQPQPAPAQASNENIVMSKLRSATATVQQIPQWAARSVAGWFTAEPPPRPPAPVPGQNFQAAM